MSPSRVRPPKRDPKPVRPPKPEPTPAPTPAPETEAAPGGGAVTMDTPIRDIGDVSEAAARRFLARSPLEPHAAAIVAAASPHSALALTQAMKESSLGKEAPGGTNNPLGLLDYTKTTPTKNINGLPFQVFTSWTDAFAEFRRRISDLSYKGGVYAPEGITLEQFIVTYVAGPDCWKTNGQRCANGETWKGRAR